MATIPTKPWQTPRTVQRVLEEFVHDIEATGGVVPAESPEASGLWFAPEVDHSWADLGTTYLNACAALGRVPVVTKDCCKCGNATRAQLAPEVPERCKDCADPGETVIEPYWSVKIPPAPAPFATEWHAKDVTVTRGVFRGPNGEQDAIRWAREHLQGCPYSVVCLPEADEED